MYLNEVMKLHNQNYIIVIRNTITQ